MQVQYSGLPSLYPPPFFFLLPYRLFPHLWVVWNQSWLARLGPEKQQSRGEKKKSEKKNTEWAHNPLSSIYRQALICYPASIKHSVRVPELSDTAKWCHTGLYEFWHNINSDCMFASFSEDWSLYFLHPLYIFFLYLYLPCINMHNLNTFILCVSICVWRLFLVPMNPTLYPLKEQYLQFVLASCIQSIKFNLRGLQAKSLLQCTKRICLICFTVYSSWLVFKIWAH